MKKEIPIRCLIYGCSSEPKEGSDFCVKDAKRLPKELRGKDKVREAIVHLATKDGYLTPDPIPTRSRTITNR